MKTDQEEISFQTKEENYDYEKYKDLAGLKGKVVAIGEIGLDYYYRPKTRVKLEQFKTRQKEVFIKQIELAKELNLPIIFHCRMAHDDMIKILKEQQRANKKQIRGVVHSFSGTWQEAEEYLEMGFYLGFNGIIFKLNLEEVIKKTSLNRILIETDCPYLTPPAKTGRNEPLFVRYIAEEVAKIKNLNMEEIIEVTIQNAKELFDIQ